MERERTEVRRYSMQELREKLGISEEILSCNFNNHNGGGEHRIFVVRIRCSHE